MILEKQESIKNVFNFWEETIKKSDILIGWNILWDKKVIHNALIKCGYLRLADKWVSLKTFDVMVLAS